MDLKAYTGSMHKYDPANDSHPDPRMLLVAVAIAS